MSAPHPHPTFIAPEPADLAPLFPGYEIQRLIAVGGMGAVYCALQKSLDRTVALKILPKEFNSDAAFCASFEAEAKAMARLNHPNLIGVYDFGEVNGMLYIIMEFVPGQSVYHAAYGIAIDPTEVIRLVSGICDGLAHAHENGIIHRDIKPSNILLDLSAQPKIGDFGLARPTDRKTEEGEQIFGTPHYTAPEVVNAPHSVDYRADIFSVGVLLHELLTSKLPADDPRPASMIVRCDTRFDAIIRKATQPIPAARYASAREMAKDLQAIDKSRAQNSPVKAPVAPSRSNPSRGNASRASVTSNRAPGASNRAPGVPNRAVPVRRYALKTAKKSSGGPVVFFLIVAAIAAYFYFTRQTPKIVQPAENIKISVAPKPEKAPEKQGKPEKPVTPEPEEETSLVPAPVSEEERPTPKPIVESREAENLKTGPKADVSEFLGKAEKTMQERTKPTVTKYRMDLNENLSKFESALKRQVRKLATNQTDKLDKYVETNLARWQAADGRIPERVDTPLSKLPDFTGIHGAAVKIQADITNLFQQEMTKQSAIYLLGLEKQVERFKADNDPGAVTLVEKEIEETKGNPQHFSNLMLKAYATR